MTVPVPLPFAYGSQITSLGLRSAAVGHNEGVILTGDLTVRASVALPPAPRTEAPAGLHNLPRPPSRRFSGRSTEMGRLEGAMCPGGGPGTHAVTQTVSGLGGVGKSSLALHYAHAHRADYPVIWWITADSPDTITASLATLAKRINSGIDTISVPYADLAAWAQNWLQAHPGWLLVFDNAAHPEDLAPYLASLTAGDHLITTRRAHGWDDIAPPPLHLDTLKLEAATGLLCDVSGRDALDDRAPACALAEELGCLPLALEQAGAYVKRTRITFTAYLQRLAAHPAKLLGAPSDGDPRTLTVAHAWRVTLDTLAERDPDALRLLRVLAWLAPDGIPRELLAPLDTGAGAVDNALALLADFSLITLSEDAAGIHRMVQAVTRTPDPDDPHRAPNAIDEARAAAASALRAAFPEERLLDVAGWPRCRVLLPHIEAHLSHARPEQDTEDTRSLMNSVSLFQGFHGQLAQAIALAERAVTTSTRLHGPDDPRTWASRGALACWHGHTGNALTAQADLEQLLDDILRSPSPDSGKPLTVAANYAYWLGMAGDPERAADEHAKLLAVLVEVADPDDDNVLSIRHNHAMFRAMAGHAAEAASAFAELVNDRTRLSGPENVDTLTARGNLAGCLGQAGNPAEAAAALQELAADMTRVLGPDHPHSLTSRHNGARWQYEAGSRAAAVAAMENLLEDYLRVLGPDHPDTLDARVRLAEWRTEGVGAADVAASYEQMAEVRTRRLGADHPSTLSARARAAYHRGHGGDATGAVADFEELLRARLQVLGPDHPDTITTHGNLAWFTGMAGSPRAAADMYTEVLNARRRVLGPDHPETQKTALIVSLWQREAAGETGVIDAFTQVARLIETGQVKVIAKDGDPKPPR
ncbi:FxSxx-COOH system tetratricopeptide repeat protein [Streptomyces sp. NPDC005336]|uniref:FxSxx-COOH system tetratricopeptide repeat protein n=1 Tax=Streptomyces sp. NPDC005336 TaxID=3157035 RepID=UPI0033A5D415